MRLLALIFASLFPVFAVAQSYPPQVSAVNPSSLMVAVDGPSATAAKADLITKIFGSGGIPTGLQPAFAFNFNPAGTTWQGSANMGTIKEWRTTLTYGLINRVYEYNPVNVRVTAKGKTAVIVAGGHGANSTDVPYTNTIKGLVASGIKVLAVGMVTDGINATTVTVPSPKGGTIVLSTHDQLWALKTPTFDPLRLFLEPYVAAVNKLKAEGYENVAMIGLSGGGWATVHMSALDDRINASYSIAGSFPMYVRSWGPPTGHPGDAEQYAISSLGYDYLDLYALAASGSDQYHANIHIVNDNCCFGGYIANHYASAVTSAVTNIGAGGYYSTLFDTTVNVHTISAYVDGWIRTDIVNRF